MNNAYQMSINMAREGAIARVTLILSNDQTIRQV